jgi:hypothetical protein
MAQGDIGFTAMLNWDITKLLQPMGVIAEVQTGV